MKFYKYYSLFVDLSKSDEIKENDIGKSQSFLQK